MKKDKKLLIIAVVIIFALWSSMFVTDYIRSYNLKNPIFATASVTADDGGSGTYKGIGYTVEMRKHIDAELGVKTDYVEMRLFGIMVLAIIVD